MRTTCYNSKMPFSAPFKQSAKLIRECTSSRSHFGYIPAIGNTLVAQEREDYGQGLKQDASSDRNCVDQIRFTLYERARLVTHAGQVCADRSIGRGTAAQRESLRGPSTLLEMARGSECFGFTPECAGTLCGQI